MSNKDSNQYENIFNLPKIYSNKNNGKGTNNNIDYFLPLFKVLDKLILINDDKTIKL
jgi:hypothetical protein